ncbi:PAS domain S-box protein [Desulfosporosinus sp.]|uniref:hybrid sensor histidine kinase/response regulator n=1 Tax=Desulfosporosinus sp. TaxID=157907 RepID=UPI0023205703|nr:PAS domain S-box protein [Desulfosporosinus sp.]MDA8224179.1 PAS domain S-box protein [Desulfitobacterium hafniense]
MDMNKEKTESNNFELIFNTTPIGMFLLNEYSLIEKVNIAGLEFLDHNSENVLGKGIGNGLHCYGSTENIKGCGYGIQCQSCQLRLAVELAFKTGQPITQLECNKVLIQNEKEKKFWFRASITPIMNVGKRNMVIALDNITNSKLVEDTAKKYQVLLEQARDIILFLDMEGNILEANTAAVQAYGYTKEELLSLKVFDIREQNDLTLEHMRQAGNQGILFETCHNRKDGSAFPVEVSTYGTFIEDQPVLVSIIREITERIRAEDLLRSSEKKYRSLFDIAYDGIILLEIEADGPLKTKIIDVNKMVCERTGYSKEEFLNLKITDFCREKEDLFKTIIGEVIAKGQDRFESTYFTKEDEEIPIEVNSQLIEMDGKRCILLFARNIAERKETQIELLKSEEKQRLLYERYRSLIINMPDSFAHNRVIYDEAGKPIDYEILEINEAYERIFRVSRKEIIGKKYSELFSGEDPQIFDQRMAEYGEVASTGLQLALPVYYSAWSERWFSVKLYSPELGYFVSLITDMTERIHVENELQLAKNKAEAANRAKSEFLANMSHEIRTPINGIVGMIDLTLLKNISQEQRGNLEIAKDCADSLLTIINDILDFSKIEAGKLVIEKIGFNIPELLELTIKAHLPLAMKKKLTLCCDCSNAIPQTLIGDPNRLKQILNNLLNNALKFTKFGGVVLSAKELDITNEMIEILFSISDSGIGISPHEQTKLFRNFSQLDGSITRKYGGTGLGLAISKQLVQMMGGTITVESQEGKGSTFSFSLKFMRSGKLNYPTQDTCTTHSMRPLRILIVEDDKVSLTVLSLMLKEKGHFIESATNGLEALALHAKNQYDVIFMDIQMPIMDGIEATAKIREKEGENQHTPIIALTAYALAGDREKFLSYGLDEYMPKPIRMGKLFSLLEEVVNRNSSADKLRAVPKHEVRISEDGVVLNIDSEMPLEYDKDAIIIEVSRDIEELRFALSYEDINLTEEIAHKIKHNCNLIEADDLKTLAFKIELAARRENQEEANKYAQSLKREFEIYLCLNN